MTTPKIKTNKVSSRRRKELNDELDVVNTTIKNLTARRDGGKNSLGQLLPPIDKELELYNRRNVILHITREEFEPVNPQFKFQTNPLWLADQKEELSAQINAIQHKIDKVNEQKNKLEEDLPVLEKRRDELEENLKR